LFYNIWAAFSFSFVADDSLSTTEDDEEQAEIVQDGIANEQSSGGAIQYDDATSTDESSDAMPEQDAIRISQNEVFKNHLFTL